MSEDLKRFTITSVEGEVPEGGTHRVRSDYVEEAWLPYLKPTAILLARKIDLILSTNHKHAIDVGKWSREMGVTSEELLEACDTLVNYALATWGDKDPTLFVARYWPTLPPSIQTPKHKELLLG